MKKKNTTKANKQTHANTNTENKIHTSCKFIGKFDGEQVLEVKKQTQTHTRIQTQTNKSHTSCKFLKKVSKTDKHTNTNIARIVNAGPCHF